jgi:hypothetical protein
LVLLNLRRIKRKIMFINGSQELLGGAATALSIGGAGREPRSLSAQQRQRNSVIMARSIPVQRDSASR